MEYCIRRATANDQQPLLLMMKEHAMFEGNKLDISQRQQQCNLKDLPVSIFVVHSNNMLIGYMSVIKQFSTWDMDWYLYLDCLYLSEKTRGHGIGLRLMQ